MSTFCDVKGSSAMAEHLDPEEVLEVMNGAFEVIIPPVYRHEGTLARLMGDAIPALNEPAGPFGRWRDWQRGRGGTGAILASAKNDHSPKSKIHSKELT